MNTFSDILKEIKNTLRRGFGNRMTGLRFKVFRITLGLITAAILIYTIAGIAEMSRFAGFMEEANLQENAVIMDTLSYSMQQMAADSYEKYVLAQAQVVDGEFWTMRHDLMILARQVQMVLENPSAYTPQAVPLPSEVKPGKLSLQLLYDDSADPSDPELNDKIQRLGSLENIFLEIVEGSDTLLDCVVSLPDGASLIADSAPELKVGEGGKLLPFNAETRPWYIGAEVHKTTYFSPVNPDYYSEENRVLAGVPVYIDGNLAAVCGGSINLDKLGKIVVDAQLGELSNSCLINENGNVLYSTEEDGELGMASHELKSLKESGNTELVALVDEALTGKSGFSLLTVDGEETYIAYAPLETIGWSQLLSISKADLNRTAYYLMRKTDDIMDSSIARFRRNLNWAILITLLFSLLLFLFSIVSSLLFSDHLVKPIKRMTRRVSQMEGDDMVFPVEDIYRTGDEIEILARAFSKMSEKMRGYVREIVDVTAEKQRLVTELSVAAEIQANMLPSHFPAFPDREEFDLYAVMDPAKEVGGDFYDFFLIDDDHLALIMADVSGKGVPAALFMVISKTLLKNVTLSGVYTSPGDILSAVNNLLCDGNEDSMFVTVWLGILTISTGHIVSACGGHEYPVFYRRDTGFVMEKDPHGLSLGAIEGAKYKEAEWQMAPGDLLFLYTDGVPEATNSAEELFGNARMLEALADSWHGQDLKMLLKDVRGHVDAFVGDAPQFDDLTMLAFRLDGD